MDRGIRRKRTERIRLRREALIPYWAREEYRGRSRAGHEVVSAFLGRDSFDRYWGKYHEFKDREIEDLPLYKEKEFPGPIDKSEMCQGDCCMCDPLDNYRDILDRYNQFILQRVKDGYYDNCKSPGYVVEVPNWTT